MYNFDRVDINKNLIENLKINVPIWIENSYLHSLLHTCVTMQNGTEWNVFFFFISTTILLKTLFYTRPRVTRPMMENQKECTLSKIIIRHSKPRKNRWRKFNATKARSSISVLTKYQNWSLFNNRLQYVTTSMLQSDRLLWRGSTRRFQL